MCQTLCYMLYIFFSVKILNPYEVDAHHYHLPKEESGYLEKVSIICLLTSQETRKETGQNCHS